MGRFAGRKYWYVRNRAKLRRYWAIRYRGSELLKWAYKMKDYPYGKYQEEKL